MQKATFAITVPCFCSHLYLQSLQRHNHTSSIQSLISRFKIHETLQINQSNFGISNNTFVQGLQRITTFISVGRQETLFDNRPYPIKANPE